jgi:hypothetical protein
MHWLQASEAAEVAPLAALLLAVGRYSSLESLYLNSRADAVAAVWQQAAAALSGGLGAAGAGSSSSGSGLGGGWLLLLYNALMSLLESDAAWLAAALPGQRQRLLLALARSALGKVRRLQQLWVVNVKAHSAGAF